MMGGSDGGSSCISYDNTSGFINAGLFPVGHPLSTLPMVELVGGNAVRSGLALVGRAGVVLAPVPIYMNLSYEGERIAFTAKYVGSTSNFDNPKGFKYRMENIESFFTVSVLNKTHLLVTLVALPTYELVVDETVEVSIDTSSLSYCSDVSESWEILRLTVTPKYIAPEIEGADAYGTTSVIISSLGSLAGADMQALAVISLMQCSTPNKQQLGNYRVLSPAAFDNTLPGILGGNMVIIIGTFVVHIIVVIVYRKKFMPSYSTYVEAAGTMFFPAVTMVMIFTFFQGVVVSSLYMLTGGLSDSFDRTLGVIGTLFFLGVLAFCVLFPRYFLSRVYYTFDFPALDFLPKWVRFLIVPEGVIMPLVFRKMFSLIINVQSPHPIWQTVRLWSSIAMSVGGAFRNRGIGSCQGVFYALATFHVGLSVLLVVARPLTLPLANYLAALGTLITTGILLCSAVYDDNSAPRADVVNVIYGLAIAQTTLTVVRFLLINFFVIFGARIYAGATIRECVWSYEAPYGELLLDGRKPATNLQTIPTGGENEEDGDLEEVQDPINDLGDKDARRIIREASRIQGATALLPSRLVRRHVMHRKERRAEKEAVLARLQKIRSGALAASNEDEQTLAETAIDNTSVIDAYLNSSSSSSSPETLIEVTDNQTVMSGTGRSAVDNASFLSATTARAYRRGQVVMHPRRAVDEGVGTDTVDTVEMYSRPTQPPPRSSSNFQPSPVLSDAQLMQEFEKFLRARRAPKGLSFESALASPRPIPLGALSSGALDALAENNHLPPDPSDLKVTAEQMGSGDPVVGWDEAAETPAFGEEPQSPSTNSTEGTTFVPMLPAPPVKHVTVQGGTNQGVAVPPSASRAVECDSPLVDNGSEGTCLTPTITVTTPSTPFGRGGRGFNADTIPSSIMSTNPRTRELQQQAMSNPVNRVESRRLMREVNKFVRHSEGTAPSLPGSAAASGLPDNAVRPHRRGMEDNQEQRRRNPTTENPPANDDGWVDFSTI